MLLILLLLMVLLKALAFAAALSAYEADELARRWRSCPTSPSPREDFPL